MEKIGVWKYDIAKNELDWDNNVKEIHGVDAHYQPKIGPVANLYRPDSYDVVNKAMTQLVKNNTPFKFECCIINPDKTEKWVHITGFIPDPKNKSILMGTFSEISNSRIEADRKNEILDVMSSIAIISISDPTGKITFANTKFQEVSEYSEAELLGLNHNILNSGFHSKEFFKVLWDTILAGKMWSGEILNKSKSGRLYWVKTYILPLTSFQGKIIEYISIRFDISKEKMIASQLLKAEKFATIGETTAQIIHDVMTPLTIIQHAASMTEAHLKSQPPDLEKALEKNKKINQSVEKIKSIFQEMRALLLGQTKYESINVYETLDLAAKNLSHILENEKIKFSIDHTLNLPNAFANKNQFVQVMSNLISNSADALSQNNEKWIRIELEDLETQIKINFIDSGSGIPDGIREKIFDSLFTTKSDGTGLGLAICKRILNDMGGDIRLNPSHPNTCFEIYLKRASRSE